jgi:2-C-methyl-D-erythritol 4-phosphate cytidylyltransferase
MGTMTSSAKTSAAAIVAAGGSGKRMGSAVPKQLLEIRNKPILFHTLAKLERVPEIGVLVRRRLCEDVRGRVSGSFQQKNHLWGGATNARLVRRALERFSNADGVVMLKNRPFVTSADPRNSFCGRPGWSGDSGLESEEHD